MIRLLRDEHFREARDMAGKLLEKTPDNVDLLAILAYAEAGLKNWEASRGKINRAIQLADKERRDTLRLMLAEIYLAEGNASAAKGVYQDLLSRNPRNTKALLGLGFLYRQTGEILKAEENFERVLKIEQGQETALKALLQIHMETGDYAAVGRVARQIPEGSKTKSIGYYFEALALARQEQPDYPQVIVLLKRALDTSVSRPQVLYTLGYMLLKNNEEEEALRVLTEAVSLAPDFFEAHKLLGIVFVRRDQLKEASRHLEKALSIEDSSELRHLLGKVYLRQGNESGMAHLMKSLENENLDPAERSSIEGLYRYAGDDLDQSEAALRQALEMNPKEAGSRILLIANLLKQGRFEDAAREAEQGISIHPEYRVVLLNLLAQAKLATGNVDQAEQILTDALQDDSRTALTRLNLSAVYLKRGQQSKAKKILESILLQDPTHVQARFRLARIYMATGDYDEAEVALREPNGKAPSDRVLLKEMVMLKISQRRYKEALESAQDMISGNRRLFDGYLAQSQAYAAHGRSADAIQSLDTGLEAAGESRESLSKAARLAVQNGWHKKAVLYLQSYISHFSPDDPNLVKLYAGELIAVGDTGRARELVHDGLRQADPDAVLLLARSYIADGDRVKAEEHLDAALAAGISEDIVEAQRIRLMRTLLAKDLAKILESNPGDPVRYISLAEVLEILGDFEAAINIYRNGLGKTGRDFEFRTQIARLFLKKDNPQQAIEAASDVLDSLAETPGDNVEIAFRANAVIGMSWLRLGDIEKAEKALERATTEGSRLDKAFHELAKIKIAKGDIKGATRLLESAIGIAPGSVPYSLALAEIYQRTGQIRKSIEVYEKGLDKDPDAIPLLNNIALLYLSEGENEKAISASEHALKLAPEDPNVLDTVGWVYLQRKQVEKAIQYLSRAADGEPKSSLYRYHLGIGYLEKGLIDMAKDELETALAMNTNAPLAQEIRKTLGSITSRQ